MKKMASRDKNHINIFIEVKKGNNWHTLVRFYPGETGPIMVELLKAEIPDPFVEGKGFPSDASELLLLSYGAPVQPRTGDKTIGLLYRYVAIDWVEKKQSHWIKTGTCRDFVSRQELSFANTISLKEFRELTLATVASNEKLSCEFHSILYLLSTLDEIYEDSRLVYWFS